LSFAVTYWDRLGWKDIFASKDYTQRQYNYAAAFRNENVYTPQVVLNGSKAITGAKNGELAAAVAAAKPLSGGPEISFSNNRAEIGAGSGTANIYLVRYDPRVQNVAIRAGENNGRTLPHKNIVRSLISLGEWTGKATSYTMPNSPNTAWKSVILVQRQGAGAIIAAKRI
jgi:hypothetical protein